MFRFADGRDIYLISILKHILYYFMYYKFNDFFNISKL